MGRLARSESTGWIVTGPAHADLVFGRGISRLNSPCVKREATRSTGGFFYYSLVLHEHTNNSSGEQRCDSSTYKRFYSQLRQHSPLVGCKRADAPDLDAY